MNVLSQRTVLACLLLSVFVAATTAAQEPFRATHVSQIGPAAGIPDSLRSFAALLLSLDRTAKTLRYHVALASSVHSPVSRVVLRRHLGDNIAEILELPFPAQGLQATGVESLGDDQIGWFDTTMMTVMIYTEIDTGGLMSGVITPTPNLTASTIDTSGMVTPPVNGSGQGSAGLVVHEQERRAIYSVNWGEMSGDAISVTIHRGAEGEDGPIAVSLPIDSGGVARGIWEGMTDEDIDAARNGRLYINIATEANPDGEIRGQLWRLDAYFAILEPEQVVPPVSGSVAGGVAFMSVFNAGSQITTNCQVLPSGIVQEVDSAHLHQGAIGENGPKVLALERFLDLPLWQVSQAPLGQSDNAVLRSMGAYVDLHTGSYSGGEVRGQLIPAATNFSSPPSAVRPVPLYATGGITARVQGERVSFILHERDKRHDGQILISDMLGSIASRITIAEGIPQMETASLPGGVYVAQYLVDGQPRGICRFVIAR